MRVVKVLIFTGPQLELERQLSQSKADGLHRFGPSRMRVVTLHRGWFTRLRALCTALFIGNNDASA